MKKTIIILLALFTLIVTGCSSTITGDAVLEEGLIKIPISEISSELTK
ncbi:lipoprotein, partial [archaeon]|nr:lipoprotein [archaeon]